MGHIVRKQPYSILSLLSNVLQLTTLVHYLHLNIMSIAILTISRFPEHDIISIIRSLNNNKAHGWDGISICMIKICDESIASPLKIIFDTAIKSGIYPEKWKKANVVPVHKKENKNI